MRFFQKDVTRGEHARERLWVVSALRFLAGGVAFAILRIGNILLLSTLKIPTMNVNLGNELTGVAFSLDLVEGILITAVLSVLAARLPYRPLVRFLAVFVPFFWVYAGGNTLELMFFSTYTAPAVINTWIDSLVELLVLSGVFVWLLPATENYHRLPGLAEILGERSLWSWIWRALLIAVLYVPTYLTFGSLIYPLVKPYYTNPAYGLNLTTPSLGPFIVLELVRGLLYVVTLLPVLAVTRGSRWQTFLYVFVFTGLFNGWQLVANLTWPAQLRLAHAAEITGDVLVQSLLFCWLLTLTFKRQKPENAPGVLSSAEMVPPVTGQETSS